VPRAVSQAVLQGQFIDTVGLKRQRLGHGVLVKVALGETAAWATCVGMMNETGPLMGGNAGDDVYLAAMDVWR
jgi:hypothetical protein